MSRTFQSALSIADGNVLQEAKYSEEIIKQANIPVFPFSNTPDPYAERNRSVDLNSQAHSILPEETWIQDVEVVDIHKELLQIRTFLIHLLLSTRLKSSGLDLETAIQSH